MFEKQGEPSGQLGSLPEKLLTLDGTAKPQTVQFEGRLGGNAQRSAKREPRRTVPVRQTQKRLKPSVQLVGRSARSEVTARELDHRG